MQERKQKKIIVLDGHFWEAMTYALHTIKPLVVVLRFVDFEKMPGMGFIYGAMQKAKKEIRENLNDEYASYYEVIKIIGKRWKFKMHQDLHAAAYLLNPRYQCASERSFNADIKLSLYRCMNKMISNDSD